MKHSHPKNKERLFSIRLKTIFIVMVFSLLIIVLFMGSQILLYSLSYEPMSNNSMRRLGNEMVKDYHIDRAEYFNKLRYNAKQYGVYMTIFTADFEEADPTVVKHLYHLASVTPYEIVEKFKGDVDLTASQISEFFSKEHVFHPDRPRSFVYSLETPPTLVYGAIMQTDFGQDVYFYMEMYRSPVAINSNFLTIQLVAASIICVIFSILLSIFISNYLSKPIISFSETAQKLAKGSLDVVFSGNGYKEIDDLANALNYATQEIKKNDSFRKEFLANITHDLRTPITMVKGYAEMIRDISGLNSEKRKVHAQTIIDEADRLTGLVGDILTMSKLESGTMELSKSTFSIASLTASVVDRFSIKSYRDGYTFDSMLQDDLYVSADLQRIEQVLYNLIENAINYTGPDKTIRISVQPAFNKALTARVEISDSGRGIAPEDINFVWDRYYRINQRKRSVMGSGLGLNIVKGILENHKADYGIHSVVGQGTTFWFEL